MILRENLLDKLATVECREHFIQIVNNDREYGHWHRSYSDGDADLVPRAKSSDAMTTDMKE